MVLYTGSQRARLAGQSIVAEVEEAIDGWFKRCTIGEDGSGSGRSSGLRMGRSRPVIPPLLELHLIQLGNKLTVGEAEVARVRFRRGTHALNAAIESPPAPEYLVSTDPEGNSVTSRPALSLPHPLLAPARARCCNCPESAPTDLLVEQLVRTMRKVVLDILEDNATSSLLRARVSRHRISASVRDERTRSSSSSSSSSASSSSSSSSFSAPSAATAAAKVAVIAAGGPPEAALQDPPSMASSPSCSSPSSLFSSPSSNSSLCEGRKEGGSEEAVHGLGEEEGNALTGLGDHSAAASRVKHIEPIFLRCSRRLEDSLAVSHSFVRLREEGLQQGGRGGLSPGRRPPACASVGDELQIRLNAILRSTHRDGEALRAPGACVPEEEAAPWPCDASPHQVHLTEGPRPPDDYDCWSQAGDASSPAGHATPSPPPAAPASPTAPHKCPNSYEEGDGEVEASSPLPTCSPRPPRCSIFTISGTLADPFGTSAKYSLRSLSTAHF